VDHARRSLAGIANRSFLSRLEIHTMIHNNTTVLHGIALYHPLIEIWSGTVRVKRLEDLKDASDHLPPSALVSDGRKRIVRKEPLRPLLAIRKRVDRLLRGAGFPFMGGIAVPESACALIESKLPGLEKEFQEAIDDMCHDLTKEYELLEEEFPAWSTMLQKSRLSEVDVRSRCRFDVVSHRVAAPDVTASPSAAKRFNKIVDAALPMLLQDIGNTADSIYEDSVRGKGRVSSKTAAVVKRLVEKLGAFSFLDPRVDPMAIALSNQLQNLPQSGYLTPVETAMLASVLNTLSDPESLIQQGAAAIQTSIDPRIIHFVEETDPAITSDMFAGATDPSDNEVDLAVAIPQALPVEAPAMSSFAADF